MMLPSRLVNGVLRALRNPENRVPTNPGYCGASRTMEVLDCYGDIYACWETVGHHEHKIGEFFPAAITDESQLDVWRNRPERVLLTQCTDCEYIAFHGGGCQEQVHKDTGSMDLKDCEDFPWIFNASAQKAWRLFKQEGQETDTAVQPPKEEVTSAAK